MAALRAARGADDNNNNKARATRCKTKACVMAQQPPRRRKPAPGKCNSKDIEEKEAASSGSQVEKAPQERKISRRLRLPQRRHRRHSCRVRPSMPVPWMPLGAGEPLSCQRAKSHHHHAHTPSRRLHAFC